MSRDLNSPIEPPPSQGEHVATVSYLGRFWDVFLELENDARRTDASRARLCFSPSDLNAGEKPARTGTIIIEPSYKDAIAKAKSFEEHQLAGLLRSALPG
ncbi:MAG: hypothetical protein EXR95_01525 [Gemmatimonadetes bacterium]|nr:hypothetical protein [Gemmatimonadota bacterium]